MSFIKSESEKRQGKWSKLCVMSGQSAEETLCVC